MEYHDDDNGVVVGQEVYHFYFFVTAQVTKTRKYEPPVCVTMSGAARLQAKSIVLVRELTLNKRYLSLQVREFSSYL